MNTLFEALRYFQRHKLFWGIFIASFYALFLLLLIATLKTTGEFTPDFYENF